MFQVKFKKVPVVKFSSLLLLTVAIGLSVIYLAFLLSYRDYFYPGVKIGNLSVGGQSKADVYRYLTFQFEGRKNQPLKFPVTYQGNQTFFTLDLVKTSPALEIEDALSQAFVVGRSGQPLEDLIAQLQTLTSGRQFTPRVSFQNPFLLDSQLNNLNLQTKKDPVDAKISISDGIVSVTPAEGGTELDNQTLKSQLENYLNLTSGAPTIVPSKSSPPHFSTEAALADKKALESVAAAPVKLHFQQQLWTIDQLTLLSLLDLNQTAANSIVLLSKEKLAYYLKNLSSEVNRPVQDAKLSIDTSSGKPKVVTFQASRDGQELDIDQTAILITQALASVQAADITLPVKVTRPKITTDQVSQYGIRELLGRGVSYFAGSIDNRIFNIGLAASRINGTLVAPGDLFSFNNTVGDISGTSGYKQAYVIKSGRTVLDDGGGVCQVSTTLFRSVLNSGLPVVDRTAHAYRVGYYEQGFSPGLDATVFSPSVDFKFKNDTSAYILVQATIAGTRLTIDLYGTSDGRISTVSKPLVSNQTPPPPDLRQDDPTLPRGTVKQVDWSAWGANVTFSRTVTRGGQTLISENYRSNYRPWQAVFLVGTRE